MGDDPTAATRILFQTISGSRFSSTDLGGIKVTSVNPLASAVAYKEILSTANFFSFL